MTATSEPRSVAVVGVGGVGGLLAATLARGGLDVRVLARGTALAAIRERGLCVRSPDGEFTTPIARISDDPAALGAADIVLVTVKSWQLDELGPRLVPLVGARTVVVPLQNGIEASEQLAAALGDARVAGGVARVISWIEEPGVIRRLGIPTSITIGARHGGPAGDIEACAAALRAGGIEVVVAGDIEPARWMKFLFIAPYSALGAVERVPLGALRSTPRIRTALEAAMRELTAVAAARGVTLPGDAVESTLAFIDRLPADATASMHRDIAEGRPSELHYLIGAVVRLGRAAGVPTPVSAALLAQLEPLERKARGLT